MKKNFIIICLFLLSVNNGISQQAYVDTAVLSLGQQTILHLTISNAANKKIIFPRFTDTITKNIEIVKQLPIDTVKKQPLTISKNYLITNFSDTAKELVIPPLPIIVNSDTVFTNPIKIKTIGLHIDTTLLSQLDTNQIIKIFDLKKPLDVKFTWKEFWLRFGRWIIIGLIVILLIITSIWIYTRYKQNKPVLSFKKPVPPHITALAELEKLKEQKLCQKHEAKEYYYNLTTILRTYLEKRFNILALERTTSELLEDIKIHKILSEPQQTTLRDILITADLAKFAQYKSSIDVCQKHFDDVKNLIEQTKPIETDEQNQNTGK